MRGYLFALLFICHVLPLLPQHLRVDNTNITYITMEEGLMHDYVDDIFRDSRGFIWLSTGSGLSRYDGFSFVNYNRMTSPIRLKGNFVHKVCEDDFNRLWIASDGGVDVLDLVNHRVVDLMEDEACRNSSFTHNPISNIIKDSNGDIWILTDYIHKVSLDEKGAIKNISKLTDYHLSTRFVALEDVDGDGNVWAGFNDNVYKLYASKENMLKAVPVSKNLKIKTNSMISKFLSDNNEVWMGTVHGLYRYYRNEDAVKIYEAVAGDPKSLTHNFISDLAMTENNQLIVGTLRGVNLYNSMSDDFDHLVSESPATGRGLNSDFINCIYYDGNAVWCGTETGGINKIHPRELNVRSYSNIENDPHSLSKNPVNVILEDEDENVWIGTVEGGLNLKREGEDTFTHFTAASSGLSHNSVSALAVDNLDRLWVGTWGNGISVIDRRNPGARPTKYINSVEHPGYLLDLVGGLLYDEVNNGMWVGSNQGLYFYDLDSDRLVTPQPAEVFTGIHGVIGMAVDHQGWLWVGSQEGAFAINLHSREGDSFDHLHYRFRLDDPESLLVERITSCYVDNDGVLWLGSDGFGFYKRVEKDDGTFAFEGYGVEDGLVNNNVKGIAEDRFGNLWISTNHGLSCFNKENNNFINYYKNDGLESNQFYWNAYHTSKKGVLYFGTLHGLVVIHPTITHQEKMDYPVTLTNFFIENELIYPGELLSKDISCLQNITLHEKYKSFTIEFSALHYSAKSNFVYAYRLEGYESKWIELPRDAHGATYMNLPPGHYTFQVKYAPVHMLNSGEITELGIYIKPYFYKTTWFALIVIVILVTSFLLWYYWHIRSYEEQQGRLEVIVEERTKELESQKGTLQKQKDELSHQNLILSRQYDKITEQKNQLIEMSSEVQRMNADRLEFFTNVSHEFRTPITLIMGPVSRALKLSDDPYVVEQLKYAERNSKYLLSLVNQLMDFQKIESKKVQLTLIKGDFLRAMESIIATFSTQAEDREIELVTRLSMDDPMVYHDPESLHKIMTNLLSNAIKFTPDQGRITVYVKSLTDSSTDGEYIYISVKDTGGGIPREDLTRVFDRFFQSKSHQRFPVYGQSGTGIGLYLCKQLVELVGGEIWVKNNRKEGCTFRMMMPLYRFNPYPEASSKEEEEKIELPLEELPILEANQPKNGRLTFLVVEDNQDMRNYICSVLSNTYHTLKAANGKEALEVLDRENVDFIISDLMMPVMDGIEFSKKVKEREDTSHIPLLMLTAKSSEGARLDSYRVGVDSYLVKPFDEEVLMTRVANILNARKRYQQLFSDRMSSDVFEMNEESNDKKFMDRVLEILNENYRDPNFTVSKFVSEMGVSKSLLNNKLNALTGHSPGQLIRIYRLNVAFRQLSQNKRTKNKNISDIAYDVGFNDPKYFTRCFSEQFKMTPSEFLKD